MSGRTCRDVRSSGADILSGRSAGRWRAERQEDFAEAARSQSPELRVLANRHAKDLPPAASVAVVPSVDFFEAAERNQDAPNLPFLELRLLRHSFRSGPTDAR